MYSILDPEAYNLYNVWEMNCYRLFFPAVLGSQLLNYFLSEILIRKQSVQTVSTNFKFM